MIPNLQFVPVVKSGACSWIEPGRCSAYSLFSKSQIHNLTSVDVWILLTVRCSPTPQKGIKANKITKLMFSMLWTHLTVYGTEAFEIFYDMIMILLSNVK